jgi:hypothetical protein
LGWYRRADGGEDLLLLGVRRGGLGYDVRKNLASGFEQLLGHEAILSHLVTTCHPRYASAQNWEYGSHYRGVWVTGAQRITVSNVGGTRADFINAVSNCGITGEVDPDFLTPVLLNCLGLNGWELVSVTLIPTSYGAYEQYTLKRPLP